MDRTSRNKQDSSKGDERDGFSIRPVPVLLFRSSHLIPRVVAGFEITFTATYSISDVKRLDGGRFHAIFDHDNKKALLIRRTTTCSTQDIRFKFLLDKRKVKRAPYAKLYHVLRFLWYKKRFEGVLDPTFHDLWTEYTESMKNGDFWRARWLVCRFPWDLAKTMGLDTFDAIISSARSLFASSS
jgi:hypothetical protein